MLLIVGGRDDVVLGLNREAQTVLRAPSKIAIVTHPGASPFDLVGRSPRSV